MLTVRAHSIMVACNNIFRVDMNSLFLVLLCIVFAHCLCDGLSCQKVHSRPRVKLLM